MLSRIASILRTKCHIYPEELIVVGVSGGPDSLCLADVLWKLEFPMVIAHLDHGLRSESQAEALKVRDTARKMGVKYFSKKENVPEIAELNRCSIEEAARVARYTFLFLTARRMNAQAVVVGHNADDQVETVLMHLIRGAGLSGLRGMGYLSLPTKWSNSIPLVRPLLSTWRSEINDYVAQVELQPVVDASNQDPSFFRNRLRHELIPELETYNPQIKKGIWRTAEILYNDNELLEEQVDSIWDKVCIEQNDNSIAFSRKDIGGISEGIKRRIIRRAFEHLRPDMRDIDFDTIERVRLLVASDNETEKLDIVSGLRLWCERESVWIAEKDCEIPTRDYPQISIECEMTMEIPGSILLNNEWVLSCSYSDTDDQENIYEHALANQDRYCAWVASDSLSAPLVVRGRQPGDRFLPLGMDGNSMKVSDFMVNEKIPHRLRDRWPLILSEDEIVWIPGHRLSDSFGIKPETKTALRLRLNKKKG